MGPGCSCPGAATRSIRAAVPDVLPSITRAGAGGVSTRRARHLTTGQSSALNSTCRGGSPAQWRAWVPLAREVGDAEIAGWIGPRAACDAGYSIGRRLILSVGTSSCVLSCSGTPSPRSFRDVLPDYCNAVPTLLQAGSDAPAFTPQSGCSRPVVPWPRVLRRS